jgi:hypothetical protein
MAMERRRAGIAGGSAGTDRDLATRSTAVDQYLELLRKCVADCGWTIDALSTEMQIDKGHLWKLLNGQKPWRLEHLLALPADVDALFAQRRAEGCGLLCVPPPENEHQAIRQLMSGLFGVLGRQTSTEKLRMAKMTLPAENQA